MEPERSGAEGTLDFVHAWDPLQMARLVFIFRLDLVPRQRSLPSSKQAPPPPNASDREAENRRP